MADVNSAIKLELTIDEVNNILRSLGKHPFEEISALILKIQSQGNPQADAIIAALKEAQAAETPKAE
jgi:hypothetical protein